MLDNNCLWLGDNNVTIYITPFICLSHLRKRKTEETFSQACDASWTLLSFHNKQLFTTDNLCDSRWLFVFLIYRKFISPTPAG